MISRGRATLVAVLSIAFIAAVGIWIRWPGFTQGGIANHDVAGILYEGMLLHAGELPYVASIEMKAPGTFYLAHWLAGPDATDIARFQVWANGWAVASLLAVAALGWRAFGPRAAVAAAAVYGFHDAFLDTMDANYVTWAQLPTVLAALASLRAVDGPTPPRGWRGWLSWVTAGILAGLAALLKRPNGVVALGVVLVAAALPRAADALARRREPAERVRSVLAAAAGFAVAHVPIALHYASHGELRALWNGYVFSERGVAYATYGSSSLLADAWIEGPLAAAHFIALPLALAAFCLWPPPRDAGGRRDRVLLTWLGLYLALGLAAASIGFRFYKGYFLAALPAAALLAAAPWGLLGSARGMRSAARVAALLPALLLAGRQGVLLHAERVNRARPHDEGGRRIAEHIRAHTPAGERIWVFGWHLWDVYPYTGRLSGSRLYKSVSVITTGNDSTWRRPRRPMHFVDGPLARLLIEDLERTRPYFIVLGGSVAAPRREFTALQDLLRRHYRRDRSIRLGQVEFWQRRDAIAPTQPDP